MSDDVDTMDDRGYNEGEREKMEEEGERHEVVPYNEYDSESYDYEDDEDRGREDYERHAREVADRERREIEELHGPRHAYGLVPQNEDSAKDVYLKELWNIVKSIDSIDSIVLVYLKITTKEFLKVSGNMQIEYLNILSKIIQIVISEEEDSHTPEGDSDEMHDAPDTVDELNQILAALHVHSKAEGLPDPVIGGKNFDMARVVHLFELYTEYVRWWRAVCGFFSDLNEIRLINILPQMLSRAVAGGQIMSPAPMVNTDQISDNATSFAPYIGYSLRNIMNKFVINEDWCILFHNRDRFKIQNKIPHTTLKSIEEEYLKLGPGIKKVLIFLNIELDSSYTERDTCMIVALNIESDERNTITALDSTWTHTNRGMTYLDYMHRMSEIASALWGTKENTWFITLSRESCVWLRWMLKDREDYMHLFMRWKTVSSRVLLPNETHKDVRSIMSILNYAETDSPLFDAVGACIMFCTKGFESGTEDYVLELCKHLKEISVVLNQEIYTAILSGYGVLSPISVRLGIKDLEHLSRDFLKMDATDNAPSETFAWAVSYEGRSTTVYALRHVVSGGFVDTHWTKLDYAHHTSAKSKRFLYDLIHEAIATTDTTEKRRTKRYWADSADPDDAMEVDKHQRTGSRLRLPLMPVGAMKAK